MIMVIICPLPAGLKARIDKAEDSGFLRLVMLLRTLKRPLLPQQNYVQVIRNAMKIDYTQSVNYSM